MNKNLILYKTGTNTVYKALLHEGIVNFEDSTSKWTATKPRR